MNVLKLPDFSKDIAEFRDKLAVLDELPAIRALLEELLEEAKK